MPEPTNLESETNDKIEDVLKAVVALNTAVERAGWNRNPGVMIHGVDLKTVNTLYGDEVRLTPVLNSETMTAFVTAKMPDYGDLTLFARNHADDAKQEAKQSDEPIQF